MRMSSLSVKRCQTVQSVHTLVLDAISLLLDFFFNGDINCHNFI